NVSSASPSAFTVSKLMVGSPNGGNNWKANQTYEITWTAANISQVNINYSIDSGAWLAISGASGITASDQSFNWTISNTTTISNDVKIRVVDASNETVNDTSNASFAVIPNLTITNPQSGIPLYAEEWYKVNWTRTGSAGSIGNVRLEYKTTEGGAYADICASTTSVPTYNWSNIPGAVLSDDCWVKITLIGNVNATDESNAAFYIRGKIQVTDPDGGEEYQVGNSTNITWTKKGNMTTLGVDIYFSHDNDQNASNWTNIMEGAPANLSGDSNGTWQWDIDYGLTTTTQGLIRVIYPGDGTNSTYDTSNDTFTLLGAIVLNQPTANNTTLTYNGSSQYEINWTKYGGIANVNITYTNDSAVTKVINGSVAAGLNKYMWNITDDIGVDLKVKVTDADNANVSDESEYAFAIKGSIEVIQPNGLENWTVNSTVKPQIQWKTRGSYPGNILIQYATDNATWLGNYSVLPGDDDQTMIYNWTVPDDIASTVKVKVSTQEGNAKIDITDSSNSNFSIIGNISVNYPNGAETYLYDGTSNITINWTAKGTVTPVRIEYSLDNGTAEEWGIVNGSVTGTQGYNEYEWPIPDERSEQCLVRVYDNRSAYRQLVNDTSETLFNIWPKLNLTAPGQGDNIFAHSTNASITWDYTGTKIKNVSLEYSIQGGAGGTWNDIEGAENVNVTYNANFTWPTVPTITCNNNARIKITDKNDSNITNQTPIFNIVGSVILSSPNGGENWTAGSSRTISWERYAVATLNISYYNGSAWNSVNDSFDTTTNQTSPWDISSGASLTSAAKVMVQDTANPNITTDKSNNTFNITAFLDVTQPETSSDVFIAEEEHYITWTKT
ncbi:MAG: hypothetical protein AAB403_16260, partial [Planctomycetota bacterium]